MGGEALEMLWELQKLRKKRTTLEKSLQDNPRKSELETRKTEIKKVEDTYRQVQGKLEQLQKNLRKEELNYEQQQEKKKELSEKLYGGHSASAKELSNLEKKLRQAEQESNSIEEKLLDFTIEKESLEEELTTLNAQLEKLKDDYEHQLNDYYEWNERIEQEINELEQEEQKVASQIPSDMYKHYEELVPKFGESVIAKLEGETCTGCYMIISTDLVGRAGGNNLVKCENCGRILYRQVETGRKK